MREIDKRINDGIGYLQLVLALRRAGQGERGETGTRKAFGAHQAGRPAESSVRFLIPRELNPDSKAPQPISEQVDFARIAYKQAEFGTNEVVRKVEERLGNFPFDDQYVNDGVAKTVVGPYEIEAGIFYYGHWNPAAGERHGFGMQIWPDGSKYTGYWKNDRTNGRGRLIHHDGSVYVGEWKDDMAQGMGEYTENNGMKYTGQWANDKEEGRGNGSSKFVGREEWPDGTVYEGEYKNGMKNGKGRFVWIDGSSCEGTFKDNMIEGKGAHYHNI